MDHQIQVLYEDNHLLALNKPGGWLVQGDETGDLPLVEYGKAYIKDRYNKPGDVFLGVVHRLDRPVSGVVVFARTSKALKRMNDLFQQREIKKFYLAITEDRPDPLEAHITHFLLKDKNRNKTRAFNKKGREKNAKKAELSYALKASIGNHHLLEVRPFTGRPHQIRVQLSKSGFPIRGDIKYGFHSPNKDGCIHLHARSLSFIHPVKKEPITISADVPRDQLWRQFRHFTQEDE